MRALLDFYTITRPGWPPLNMVVFSALMISSTALALWRGGPPEKIAAIMFTLSAYYTYAMLSASTPSFRSIELGILVVDIILLVALVVLALRADRFWPLWLAALQLVGTAAHGAKFVDPSLADRIYAFLLAVWAYPTVLLLFVGTWRHQKRLARFGTDRAWSPWKVST